MLGISIIVLAFAAWMWMANPSSPRLKNVGDDSPDSTTAHAVEIGLAALALLALVGAALALRATVRLQRREARLVEELQGAREQFQALSQVLDVWQWVTDEQHRLVDLRPPDNADTSVWASLPESLDKQTARPFIWEYFHAGVTGNRSLRAKLDARAALDHGNIRLVAPNKAAAERRVTPNGGLVQLDSAGDGNENAKGATWRLRAAPRFDHEGRFCGYIGTAREVVTVNHDATGAARTARDTGLPDTVDPVDSAQMMADSEAFSYTVSHDLRAPIRVVEGFTKILKEDYGRQLDRVGNDHLERVLGAAARMNSMIDALLALAQLQATPLVRQPINLSQLAHYIVDDLRRQSPEREVSVHIEPGMQVRGDPTLMRIALENLLGNAWKYSAKRRLAQIWFESETLDQGPAFSIRDNGAGFDMRFADRLFGVFQRLHSANDFQGTGVGLASVRRIVRRHGGEIWAESEPERGANFHFTLPQRSVR
jgi:signal transduction histidine kinase